VPGGSPGSVQRETEQFCDAAPETIFRGSPIIKDKSAQAQANRNHMSYSLNYFLPLESAAMLKRLLLLCLLSLISALPVSAMSVLPLYLDQIVDGAALVFEGSCTGNRSERDPQTGMIVTYTTFQVDEVLKGVAGPMHTIKQIGGQIPGETTGLRVSRIEGVPGFEVGGRYVVFLHGVSPAGFSSPVGLGQGSFRLQAGAASAQVSNGRDFREMTAGRDQQSWPQSAQAQFDSSSGRIEQIGLDDFKQFVRRQAGSAK
jgi:hypothetical protein